MAQLFATTSLSSLAASFARHRHLIVPVACLALIGVLIVPLPPALMDLLICLNLALAAIILLTTIYMPRPLEFSVFPTLLLGTTLFRLVLNIASTRLILTADAASPAQAERVAGDVIRGFGEFVARDSQVVGFIIFLILVIVQFVVITKGATRMSEVAARFALDAMPGKQMAIDADVSAGLITEQEARDRRSEVVREADFYGAMDGASKFVRGDAVAGLAITVINILGGFAIGVFEKGWTISESLSVFTMLTIGDGLVSQIPAFVIAIAAGLIVARASDRQALGEEIPAQLVSQPVALYLIAGFLALLAFSPLPALPLLAGAGGLCIIAVGLRAARQRETVLRENSDVNAPAASGRADQPALEDLLRLDAMEIEIGFGLVPMVDAGRGGDLLERIGTLRRSIAAEIGVVVPPIRIRDNMTLGSDDYRIKLRGGVIGEGVIHRDRLLAILQNGAASDTLDGIRAREPVFGLPAVWIEPADRSRAEALACSLVEPDTILPTHLSELIRRHADEILTREEVNHLIEELRKTAPKLVEEAIPAVIRPGELQRVLQSLLRERIPIRDLETIVETMADWKARITDPEVLYEYVRHGLRRTISGLYTVRDAAGVRRLYCITLSPEIEAAIDAHLPRGSAGATMLTMPEESREEVASAVEEVGRTLTRAGRPLVVLVSPKVRSAVRQILVGRVEGANVLSHAEMMRDVEIVSTGLIGHASGDREGAAPRESLEPVA
jgi:flagellar biosynthesis protein FlhA